MVSFSSQGSGGLGILDLKIMDISLLSIFYGSSLIKKSAV
jgi:hypothetical protein